MNSDEPREPSKLSPTHPIGKAAVAYCIAIGFAILLLERLQTPLQAFAAPDRRTFLFGVDPLTGAAWGLGLGLGLAATSELFVRFTRWGREIMRVLQELVGGLHPVDALLLAALSAVGEELVFRGILLPYLGIWGSSALFGAVHFVPRKQLWVWALWAAGAGLAFAWLALETGGLLAPTLAHFTVNALGLLLLGIRR